MNNDIEDDLETNFDSIYVPKNRPEYHIINDYFDKYLMVENYIENVPALVYNKDIVDDFKELSNNNDHVVDIAESKIVLDVNYDSDSEKEEKLKKNKNMDKLQIIALSTLLLIGGSYFIINK
jgi:hypothetical protein